MRQMPYKELVRQRDEKNFRIIDVREPDEFAEVHVKGAELFPLSKLRDGEYPEPDERPVAVICRVGGRSQRACQMLEAAGWEDLYNVSDGTIGAVEAGEEHVVRGDEPDGE